VSNFPAQVVASFTREEEVHRDRNSNNSAWLLVRNTSIAYLLRRQRKEKKEGAPTCTPAMRETLAVVLVLVDTRIKPRLLQDPHNTRSIKPGALCAYKQQLRLRSCYRKKTRYQMGLNLRLSR
jgi:hypothetical protein